MRPQFLLPLLFPGLLSALTACNVKQDSAVQPDLRVQSPDGQLSVALDLTGAGQPVYEVTHGGQVVLESSQLGWRLEGSDLSQAMALESVSASVAVHDEYTLGYGKVGEASYHANERVFHFTNEKGERLDITFRVSNDGVAFQYSLPSQPAGVVRVKEELTSFDFTDDSRAWLQPIAVAQEGWGKVNPSYEEHYQMGIPVDESSPSPAGWVFPALFHTAGGWVAITEAGMDGHYHASRLQADSPEGEYHIGYPMAAEAFTGGALLAETSEPLHSPWRIIAVGDLPTLMDSTLGTDLAAPAVAEMPWVKPGVASWSWALLKDDSVNYDTQKQFIDYAADMGWDYTLVDVNWDRNIGYEKIAELADYAAEKKVGLILWYNSSGDWNETKYTPKSALLTREQRRAEFARLQAMGIAGVKVDFFAGDGQSMMAYYLDILRDAADFELLVNFHGATLPRGWQRTYPNLMTMEAVRGFEYSTFEQETADLAPSHVAMLPFTRNLFDPMDFTPTAFSPIPNIERRTRDGFELALPVLMLSGIQHIAETAEGMAKVPDFVRDYMRDIPVSWDESRLVAGYPGKYAVIARRAGDTWYLVGINGEAEDRALTLDLSFLDGRTGQLIGDGEAADTWERAEVTANAKVAVTLRARGGLVIKFP